jgi:hypothetical protein
VGVCCLCAVDMGCDDLAEFERGLAVRSERSLLVRQWRHHSGNYTKTIRNAVFKRTFVTSVILCSEILHHESNGVE